MTFHRTPLLSSVLIRFAVVMLLFPLPAAASDGYWSQAASAIAKVLSDAQTKAAQGQSDAAREAIEGAYFDIFEESRMEVAERLHLGMAHVTALEELFHQAEDASGDAKALKPILAKLNKQLKADAAKLERDGVQPDRKAAK